MKKTYIYAYPFDRLPRDSKDQDIINDYNRMNLKKDELPVRKYTVEEFCALVNDDMFNDQEYFVRAVEEDDEANSVCPVSELREKYKKEIIEMMQRNGLTEIDFEDDDNPEFIYVFWQDRHDMWNRDPIIKIKLENKGLVFECRTDNDETVTLYVDSDYGCDLVEVLDDIKFLVQEYVQGQPPACPYCG